MDDSRAQSIERVIGAVRDGLAKAPDGQIALFAAGGK